MSVIPIHLAVEDQLSESVARRLLNDVDRDYAVGVAYGREGFGYLRKTIHGWNRAAKGIPFMVITDLDRYPCASALIREWLVEPQNPNLLLRVAVREVESWLLADGVNLARYLAAPERHVPADPDKLQDPKSSLIELASRSRSKELRYRIIPRAGSTAKQGPDYNSSLSHFVRSTWDIRAASLASPSLARTIAKLNTFTPDWGPRK
jgi:hypothetical protein